MGRIADFFKKLSGQMEPGSGETYVDVSGAEGPAGPVPTPPSVGKWLSPFHSSKRDQQMTTLQTGYLEMVDLLKSIRENLETQTRAQEKVLGVMDRVGEAADGLKGVTRSAEQQAETLLLIRKSMEDSVGQGGKMVDSLNRFNETLALIDHSSRGTVDTLSGLVERMRESEQLVRRNLERSERRLTILIIALMVVIGLAIGSAFYLSFLARPDAMTEEWVPPPFPMGVEEPPAFPPLSEEPVPGIPESLGPVSEESPDFEGIVETNLGDVVVAPAITDTNPIPDAPNDASPPP